MKVYRISAVTLKVKDTEKSCSLYSRIPGFRLTYGGGPSDSFTTFEIGEGSKTTCLNLERIEDDEGSSDFSKKPNLGETTGSGDFGRLIFHTENVDKLYSYMKHDEYISKSIVFEMNLPMLHEEKGSFIFVNQMAINYHLHSHCSKWISNLLVIYCCVLLSG